MVILIIVVGYKIWKGKHEWELESRTRWGIFAYSIVGYWICTWLEKKLQMLVKEKWKQETENLGDFKDR